MREAVKDEQLPERPRLRLGCRVFEDATGVIVRSSEAGFRIEPAHRDAMLRVIERLDGTREFAELLGGEAPADAFYALRMLDSFGHCELLAEGPLQWQEPASPEPPARLDGVRLACAPLGPMARVLAERCVALGASVRASDEPDDGETLLLCPDGSDIAQLRAVNARALQAGFAWLPVLLLGDAIVTGPRMRRAHTACWACFELRWLGISPSIELERAYLEHCAQGGFAAERVADEAQARQLVARILPVLARQLAGHAAGRIALTRIEQADTRENQLVAHPLCEACRASFPHPVPGEPTRTSWLEAPLPLAQLADDLGALIGEPCGLSWIYPPPTNLVAIGPELRKLALSRFAMPEPADAGGAQDNWCHGASATMQDARVLAHVEAIERYCGLFPPSCSVEQSYEALGERALLPTELTLYSQAQYAKPGFRFRPFEPARPLRWVSGYDLTHDRPIWVPASAAGYGYDDDLLSECSSGVAAHSSRGLALLNGALELCERDAFMLHWLQRISPPQLALETLQDPLDRAIVERLELNGYAVRVMDLTTDLDIPAYFAAAVRTDAKMPALLVGAGAGLDPAHAVSRALFELYSALSSVTTLWTLKPKLAPDQIVSLDDHSKAYEHPDWLPQAEFLWQSPERRPCPQRAEPVDGLQQLASLVERLQRHGHRLIGVELTPADVATTHLRVVRALVPGLQPLAFGAGPRLGGTRVYEAPARMGLTSFARDEAGLNPMPHCFP